MTTAQVVRTDLSGTSFVLDVTALELNSSLLILDFEITHNGAIVSSSYAKTSASQLTYSGAAVTLGTRVIARRTTTLTQAETTFISTTTAAALTNALDKERLRLDELDNRITYVLGQLVAGGINIGTIPISSTAFGAAWNGDNTNAPSRAAVFNKDTAQDTTIAGKADTTTVNTSLALKAPIDAPVFTTSAKGITTPVTTNTTDLATTAYVINRVSSRTVFQNTNSPSISPASATFTTLPTLTGAIRSSFGDSYAAGVITIGTAGSYLVSVTVGFTGSVANMLDALIAINFGAGDVICARANSPTAVQYSVQTATIAVTLAAGATITPKVYVSFGSGTATASCFSVAIVQL